MIDILLELLFNRLGAFLLGVALIVGGVYVWTTYRTNVRAFDAATGTEGRAVEAVVAWKGRDAVDNYSKHGGDSYEPYFTIEYDHDGETQRVKVPVYYEEWDKYELNDPITIKYHQSNLEFLVTPETKRESTLLATIFSVGLLAVGLIIILAVIVSLF